MQKLITQVSIFRFGVHHFENRVNSHLENGWEVAELSIEKKFFKIVCYALLEKVAEKE